MGISSCGDDSYQDGQEFHDCQEGDDHDDNKNKESLKGVSERSLLEKLMRRRRRLRLILLCMAIMGQP